MQYFNKSSAIMQPTYLPWLGYFNLIESVDNFVFFDDVKLLKRSWHVRNKIIEKYETEKYLTIPVFFENKNLSIIKDAKVDDSQKWRKKHLSSIKFNYKKHEFFDQIFPLLEKNISSKNSFLIDITVPIIIDISNLLGLRSNFMFSSDIDYFGKNQESLISICKYLNTSNYISPIGSKDYILNDNEFKLASINLKWHEYNHPVYPQKNNCNFISHLSIIDALFNLGINGTKELIRD